jgi:hypothetical protein
MKQTCERHCFSTLNHNLAYCYEDPWAIKWFWKQAKRRFQEAWVASRIDPGIHVC